MPDTSVSLLDRLSSRPDADSWQRLVDVYSPLLRGWLARFDVAAEDVDDLVQEVMTVLVKELPQFRHNQRPGAFRHWLRSIAVNRLRAFWRARKQRPVATGDSAFVRMLDELEDAASGLSRLWDQEHDRHVTARFLELVKPDFQPASWRAFQLVVLEGRPAADVAAELKTSVNAVLIAKSRVLRRLRQEMQGILD